MDTSVAIALLGLAGSLLAAVVTYWLSKLRDFEAERRKEKLAYYKAFIESLSGIVEGDATPNGHLTFSRATNNLLLFAPQAVLIALDAFRSEISFSNASNRTQEKHDALLADLLLLMREDIGVLPPDERSTFRPVLWTSGSRRELGKN